MKECREISFADEARKLIVGAEISCGESGERDGIESECVELALQGADIVSPQERRMDEQGAVPQPEACFDELFNW